MDLKTVTAIAQHIDPPTARAFVGAAFNVIKAALIVREQELAASTPGVVDYETAQLDRSTPAGGWLTDETLKSFEQRMTEAVSLEKWSEGFITAVELMALVAR